MTKAPNSRALVNLTTSSVNAPLTVSLASLRSPLARTVRNMAFTLGEAARQCGVAKGTISKAIKTGKLSATRREDHSWAIDNAELARYLEANQHRFRSDTVEFDQVETEAATDALVAELRSVIADLRSDRDAWRDQAQRLALPAPKLVEATLVDQAATPVDPPKRRWWKRASTTV